MCIWIDIFKPIDRNSKALKIRETIVYGAASINIFTGKSSLFENQVPFYLNPTTFDDLERFVSIYSPSELILLTPFDENINNNILQYIGIKTNSIHCIDTRGDLNEKVINCEKQKYVDYILSKYFGEETINVCNEFQMNQMATQAFCYLLCFIKERNKNLLNNIFKSFY
jgi:DNA mismatch repair ATPase MutS